MHKAMVFIDYENFEIARNDFYKDRCQSLGESIHVPKLDMVKFTQELVDKISPDYKLIKTFLFVPKPDDFLMQETWRKKRYDYLKSLGNLNFFSVIEGRHASRQVDESIPKDINKKSTYVINEKGTDINMASHMLTKAFHNSYDTAVVVSGDTDYIPVLNILNTIGKTVIVVGVKGQQLISFKEHSDKQFTVDARVLDQCIYEVK